MNNLLYEFVCNTWTNVLINILITALLFIIGIVLKLYSTELFLKYIHIEHTIYTYMYAKAKKNTCKAITIFVKIMDLGYTFKLQKFDLYFTIELLFCNFLRKMSLFI